MTVGPLVPVSSAWVVLIVALCLPAGLGVLASCVCLQVGRELFAVGPGAENVVFGMIAVYCMACVPLTAIALSVQSQFRRLSVDTQWAIAVIVSFATGLAFLTLLGLMVGSPYQGASALDIQPAQADGNTTRRSSHAEAGHHRLRVAG